MELLDPKIANVLQEKAIFIELVGFFLAFIEVFYSEKADWIELKIDKYAYERITLGTLFEGSKKDIFIRFLVLTSIISFLALFFGIVDIGEWFILAIFGPFIILFSAFWGGVFIVVLFDNIPIRKKIGELGFFSIITIVIPSFFIILSENISKVLEYILGMVLCIILAAVFLLAIKVLSKTLYYLNKLAKERALGAFGLILASVGLIFEIYQVSVLWWA